MTIERMLLQSATWPEPHIPVKVIAKEQLARDIVSLRLVADGGPPLPSFTPGAHVDLHLPGDLIRQFSLCNDSFKRDHYRIAVRREPNSRGGSIALHDRVRAGDRLRISAVRNNFKMHPARRTLLLGGGIGVTPFLPMATQAVRLGKMFELHCYNKSPEYAAFFDELQHASWARHVHHHFSHEGQGARQRIVDLFATVDPATHVYACGPAGFVEHVIQCASQAGLDERQIHYEPFALPDVMKPSLAGPAFQVELRSTGRRHTIQANEAPTRALARQGIRIPVSCEEGNCGTCQTGVLDGIPDHRDVYLSDSERADNRTFIPCCSRARTPLLVLDL